MPAEGTITNEQKIQATLNPVTATGQPAQVDGAPVWTVDGTSVTVQPADDGLSAWIPASDTDVGDSTITVSADADLGQGVTTIQDTILIHVQHAQATSLGMTLGDPQPK